MVMVTGATGLVGSHLLYKLLINDEKVRALKRFSSDTSVVKKVFLQYTTNVLAKKLFSKIEWVDADINDLPALDNAFSGVKKVYHTAALVSFDEADYREMRKVNIEGTANIVNLCLAFKIEKLCALSSVATLSGKPDADLINEEDYWDPDRANSGYAISKFGAEMELWRGSREGLDTVIINPGVILGSACRKSAGALLLKRAKQQIRSYPAGGAGFIDVRDVVEILIRLMNSDIKNERFIAVSENKKYGEIMVLLSRLLQLQPPKRYISSRKLKLAAFVDGVMAFLKFKKRILNFRMARMLDTVLQYDNRKIKKTLDYSFIPIEKSLEQLIPSSEQQGV